MHMQAHLWGFAGANFVRHPPRGLVTEFGDAFEMVMLLWW